MALECFVLVHPDITLTENRLSLGDLCATSACIDTFVQSQATQCRCCLMAGYCVSLMPQTRWCHSTWRIWKCGSTSDQTGNFVGWPNQCSRADWRPLMQRDDVAVAMRRVMCAQQITQNVSSSHWLVCGTRATRNLRLRYAYSGKVAERRL